MKYNALVLSGGGFNGYYQYSIIEELLKNKVKFDYVCGCSTGSLNAAMLATNQFHVVGEIYNLIKKQGMSVVSNQEYAEYVKGEIVLNKNKLFRKATRGLFPFNIFNFNKTLNIISKNLQDVVSLSDNAPLLDILKKHIRLDNFEIPCEFATVELNEGCLVNFKPSDFDDADELCKSILASTSMPGIWSPVSQVRTRSKMYYNLVDGGVRDVNPLNSAVTYINKHDSDNDSWTVWIINCSTGYVEPSYTSMNIMNIVKRCLLDISLNEIGSNDVSGFIAINEILSTFNKDKLWIGKKVFSNFKTVSFTPERPLGEALDCSKEQLELRYWLGKKAIEKLINEGIMDNIEE